MDLPRPEVTVTDPRQRGALVPVEEPAPPTLGRRGARRLAAAALVAAGALFAADVVRDRRDAVEQRRLDRVVDVALAPSGSTWASSHDARTGTGTVEAAVRLVNRGPRDVRVVSAELGRLRTTDGPTVRAGEDGPLVLTRSFRCPADGGPPPPQPAPRELRVRLETPAGVREVSMAVRSDRPSSAGWHLRLPDPLPLSDVEAGL